MFAIGFVLFVLCGLLVAAADEDGVTAGLSALGVCAGVLLMFGSFVAFTWKYLP